MDERKQAAHSFGMERDDSDLAQKNNILNDSSSMAAQPETETETAPSQKRRRVSSGKRRKAKLWTKPKGMPKRPLSAYNLFFAEERKRLLAVRKGEESLIGNSGEQCGDRAGASPKLGFAGLARAVATSWKNIDPAAKAIYQMRSEQERDRYKREVREWEVKMSERGDSSVFGNSDVMVMDHASTRDSRIPECRQSAHAALPIAPRLHAQRFLEEAESKPSETSSIPGLFTEARPLRTGHFDPNHQMSISGAPVPNRYISAIGRGTNVMNERLLPQQQRHYIGTVQMDLNLNLTQQGRRECNEKWIVGASHNGELQENERKQVTPSFTLQPLRTFSTANAPSDYSNASVAALAAPLGEASSEHTSGLLSSDIINRLLQNLDEEEANYLSALQF